MPLFVSSKGMFAVAAALSLSIQHVATAAAATSNSFVFVSTEKTVPPKSTSSNEPRGYHFVLPSLSTSDLTYGCGIDGELILFEGLGGGVSPPRAQSAVTGIAPETLLQARTLLWDRPNRLIVSSRDLLFFDVEADGTLLLATNVSTPLSSSPSKFPGGGDAGINGLIRVTDVENNTLVVGAGMPGILVTALVASDQAAHPVSFGSLNVSAKGWLDAAYDIDSYQPKPSSGLLSEVASSPSSSQPPPPPPPGLELPVVSTVAVVVSAHQRNSNSVVGVIQLTNPATGAIQPPAEWTFLGGVDLPSEAGAARGCNRVRVHQRSRRAAFSCFGGGVGRDVVGFIDLTDVSHPNVTSVVPFVSQQPTGMLVVGDVLFVAGELDLMAFDMRNSTPAAFLSPPLLATCGTACRQVGNATGQNFHSLGYKLESGRHLLFLSAQIDNAVGCVEITDERIIKLLTTTSRQHE